MPLGENTRYDLVTDDGRCLRKVQCKTGRLRQGAVIFAVCSHYGHHQRPKPSRDYLGQIDDFAVFCPALGAVYLVPIDDLETTSYGTLRVDPPRNAQRKRIRFAAAYEVARIDVY
jgi:extradiol dioxygenase family protein